MKGGMKEDGMNIHFASIVQAVAAPVRRAASHVT
jgi:hypothetical protein